MNKVILLASVAAFSLATGAAISEDRAAAEIPLAPVTYDWEGFYAGVHLGVLRSSFDFTNVLNQSNWGDVRPGKGFSTVHDGGLAGVQMGYNWQSGSLVYGLEFAVTAFDGQHSWTNPLYYSRDDLFTVGVSSVVLATGRVGYAFERTLLYVNGGFAGGNFSASAVDTVPPFMGAGSESGWANGYSIGAGFEQGLDNNLTVGAQYTYTAFPDIVRNVGGATPYLYKAHGIGSHSVALRINYGF